MLVFENPCSLLLSHRHIFLPFTYSAKYLIRSQSFRNESVFCFAMRKRNIDLNGHHGTCVRVFIDN